MTPPSRTRSARGFAAAAAAICAVIAIGTGAARAQAPGTYIGKDADGFDVQLIVYQDEGGHSRLSRIIVTGFMFCDGKELLTLGKPVPYGAGALLAAPFHDGVVKFAGISNQLGALRGNARADGDTLSGTIVGYAALFAGDKSPPGNGEAKSCRTRDLTFTAGFSKGP